MQHGKTKTMHNDWYFKLSSRMSPTVDDIEESFSSDYKYEIRHFRAKLGAVCSRHLTKLAAVGVWTTKLVKKLVLKSSTTKSFG